jgi:dipeptidyl aminopeptidase/acylaminoacyl peptidase
VKLTSVALACSAMAVLGATSTQPTQTPAAHGSGVPTIAPTPVIEGPIPTSPAVTTTPLPQDVFVPGRLIYVKGRTIYMVHDYDAPVPLANDAGQPSVSPDGSRLAYVQFFKNYQNLRLLDIQQRSSSLFLDDTLTDPNNANTGMTASAPSWSDDGKSIYFAWTYPGSPCYPPYQNTCSRSDLPAPLTERNDFSITRCPVSGPCSTSTAVSLTTPYFEASGDYAPAPRLADPNYLVYAKWQYLQARDNTSRALPHLQALNLNDDSEVSLTDPLDYVSEPVWSPNGRYLAFVKASADLQSSSIWIMAFHPPGQLADYAKARLLVSGGPLAGNPVFSPDGKDIAFVQSGSDGRMHLYIAPITFGKDAHIGTPQEVKRADIVDGDRLAWAPS